MAVSICFFTVIKHVPRHRGSKVDPNKKKTPVALSYTRCPFIRLWHFESATFFMTIEDIKHTYLCSIFRPHYVTAYTYLPSWIWLAGSLYAWTSSLSRFRYKNLRDGETEIKQANDSQRKDSEISQSQRKW